MILSAPPPPIASSNGISVQPPVQTFSQITLSPSPAPAPAGSNSKQVRFRSPALSTPLGKEKSNGSIASMNGTSGTDEDSNMIEATDAEDDDEIVFLEQRRVALEEGDEDNEEEEDALPQMHVEVRLQPQLSNLIDAIRRLVHLYITNNFTTLIPFCLAPQEHWGEITILSRNVESITFCECHHPSIPAPVHEVQLVIHVYQPSREKPTALGGERDDDEGGDLTLGHVADLPNEQLEGIWDSLFYGDDALKERLLKYIYSTFLFSDNAINSHLISWNRLLILYGPPGTGKTSLCRALAQKLSLRLSTRYATSKLVEINSASIFSKWFSESGKLVQQLFDHIQTLALDGSTFVCVLIDEVESIAAARSQSLGGSEPGDAMRVVNAILTQLDQLKTRPNVLVMATSNLSKAIDPAFVDRADIKQYVGLPPPRAIYEILLSSLRELQRCRLMAPHTFAPFSSLPASSTDEKDSLYLSVRLKQVAELCCEKGMSARSLRRLPVLAHAREIGVYQMGKKGAKPKIWIDAVEKVVRNLGEGEGGEGLEK
ncbi:AAA-domain-containing protein [Atractiella rhizophila]|nr:AAA-domain-containing protein [Atractiella rhizophila]